MKRGRPIVLMLVAMLAWAILTPAVPCRADNQIAQPGESLNLPGVVMRTMEYHFSPRGARSVSLDKLAGQIAVPGPYKKRAGVFVTLSVKGKPRACWGSIFPEHPDLVKATVYSTIGALTKDYRYPPVKRSEWKLLKAQVTVIKDIQPIHGLSGVNPLADGLMVRAGSKSGVLLPGEARDAHYQLVACKLKAGIQAGEPFQMYRIKADIYD